MFTDKSNMSNVTAMKPPLPPGGADPTLQAVMDAAPPMVYAGGYNVLDPKNCEAKKAAGLACKTWDPTATGGWNAHTFTGKHTGHRAISHTARCARNGPRSGWRRQAVLPRRRHE